MLRAGGFRGVVVRKETGQGTIKSFEDYWTDVEAGAGMMPQAYRALLAASQRCVREEVRVRLSKFEADGGLVMSVDMLIGAGRA